MIDPKELRIGNIAQSPVGWIGEVIELKTSFVRLYKKDDLSAFQFGSDLIDPIPITPEWLERFGFRCMHKQHCEIWEILITDYPDQNDNVLLSVVFSTGQICVSLPEIERHDNKYIHSLQNLYFALTGNELTIK